MRKIPTIFERDWSGDRSRVLDVPHPLCGWVFAGEGWPTRKIDGTCCMVRDGKLFKRRELRGGDATPMEFEAADFDEETGRTVGWVPVGDGAEDRWHREALAGLSASELWVNATYELVGPKIQGNPEGYERHELIAHDALELATDVPRTFKELRDWLAERDMEGIVFHHADGRMAKIKKRDFGLKRKPETST